MARLIYQTFVKPLADRLFALLLIALFSPVMLLVAIIVRSAMGKPVIFAQRRPGKNGKLFTIYKFRTMTIAGSNDAALSDEARLTGIGRLIRSLSLDELPQLFNVLKGEMSFIGPRPLLIEYLPRYNEFQARRHKVLPGITGLAQVNGRNAQSWRKRFGYDVFYAENLSFWLDIQILLKTFYKVLRRDGISANGSATKEPFLGNGDRLFVYGAGGHGRVVAESAARSGLRIEGFIDDSGQNGITRSEFLERAAKERFSVALAIGDNKTRRKIALELNKNSVEIATIIDPSAQVSCSAHIGKGAVILAGAVVNSQARIEEGAIVNSGAVVEHDCVIGAYAHVSPNAALAGGARAESLAHIGIGACLINNVSVGKESIVGAGAVVTKDILPFCTAVGAPARAIKSKIDEKPAQE